MRVLSIVHQRDAGPGSFADVAAARGDELVEWMPPAMSEPPLDGISAAMVFGGGVQVDHEATHPWLRDEKHVLRELLARGTPVLGVCLGAQLLADVAGGSAGPTRVPVIGWEAVELTADAASDRLFRALPRHFEAFEWHSYEVDAPPGATILARSAAHTEAFRLRTAWGVQFHAEVTAETIERWVRDHGGDEDVARADVDGEALLGRSAAAIGAWNEVGTTLSRRFLEFAAEAEP